MEQLKKSVQSLGDCRDADTLLAASQQIYTAFVKAIDSNLFHLHRRPEDDTQSDEYAAQLTAFLDACLSFFSSTTDDTLVEAAFSAAMQVLKIYTHSLPDEFPATVFEKIVMASVPHQTATRLLSTAMRQFADLHVYGHRLVHRLVNDGVITMPQGFMVVVDVEMTKAEMPAFCHQPSAKATWKKRAAAFSACWMQLLKTVGEADEVIIKQVLLRLDEHIIPFLSKPALLIDFLASLFTRGGTVGWLALSSLFTLIRKHRLDYPKFFDHLLTMLTPQVMHSRFRKRFLSLTGTFMRSTHLSVAHKRAFLKRVVRLAVSAPPSAARWIVPFSYNMLKEHHSDLHDMIHQNPDTHGVTDEQLHELSVLFAFHVGPIARQAAMLKERMVRPTFSLEKYLRDGDRYTVAALLEAELSHKWSKAPPIATTVPSTLFHPMN